MADEKLPPTNAANQPKTTEEITAIVDKRLDAMLKKHGYVTVVQMNAAIEAQTNAFQASMTDFRREFKEEVRHWNSATQTLDDHYREILVRNDTYISLASNVKGQNEQIANSLTRFSDRLDDIADGLDERMDAKLSQHTLSFRDMLTDIKKELEDLKARVIKVETASARRDAIEARAVQVYKLAFNKRTAGILLTIFTTMFGASAATGTNYFEGIILWVQRLLGGG